MKIFHVLFLQEDVDICFIAIETCFIGKNILEEVFKNKILNSRINF